MRSSLAKLKRDERFEAFFHKYRLTNFCVPSIKFPADVHRITPSSHPDLFLQYEKLTTKCNLRALTDFQKECCVHYVWVEMDVVKSGMSVLYACMKFMPTRICASVELIISKKPGHASVFLEKLRLGLRRKRTAFIITQAASNQTAKKFWGKHAVANKEAKYLSLMVYAIDARYKICVDTTFAMIRV